MNYCEIITNDTANGTGIRLSLFVSGCEKHCKGCFQPQTWDFNYGQPFTEETLKFILEELKKPQYDGVTILGGEPLHPKNRSMVAQIIAAMKEAYPKKDIWVYTGYTYEELQADQEESLTSILHNIDMLVDGPFIEELKDFRLDFRGSSNQNLIDMTRER